MSGFSAFGTQFQRHNGSTFVTIAEATNISGPELERDTIDVSSHDSPNRFREWVGGMVDGGEVTFEVNWDPAEHATLKADFNDALPRQYRILLPSPPGGNWTFSGFITGMTHEYPYDDKMSAEFTFKISGDPVFTP